MAQNLGRPLVIYDGKCKVCSAFRRWGQGRDPDRSLSWLPFQSELMSQAAPDVSPEQASRTLIFITEEGRKSHGARAVFMTLRCLKPPWNLIGTIMAVRPVSALLEPFYRLFAKYRGKFGWLIKEPADVE